MSNAVLFTTKPCMVCHTASEVFLPEAGYAAWVGGMFVQDAFPHLDADQREQLITGTHPACWTELFGEDDE